MRACVCVCVCVLWVCVCACESVAHASVRNCVQRVRAALTRARVLCVCLARASVCSVCVLLARARVCACAYDRRAHSIRRFHRIRPKLHRRPRPHSRRRTVGRSDSQRVPRRLGGRARCGGRANKAAVAAVHDDLRCTVRPTNAQRGCIVTQSLSYCLPMRTTTGLAMAHTQASGLAKNDGRRERV